MKDITLQEAQESVDHLDQNHWSKILQRADKHGLPD